MLPGWDDEALLEEVLGITRRAFVPMPGLRVIERPGWMQSITPSFKQGALNQVSLSVLDPSEADAVIDATIAEYRALGVRFRWDVRPGSMPADLEERLARRGLMRSTTVAMACLARDAPEANAAGVEAEEVGRHQADEYVQVLARAWQCDPEPFHTLIRTQLEQPETGQRLFWASYEGRAAATAVCVMFSRSAYLLGGAVVPEFRRKGVYRALVAARMRAAAARGLSLVTCLAMSDTSAPLLARMGFVSVARFSVFHG